MSDRLGEILREWFFDGEPLTELDDQEMFLLAEGKTELQSYIDTKVTKGLLKNPSKLRIGMLRQALNEDRITDPDKMVDNEYIEHWLGIAELKLKGEKE